MGRQRTRMGLAGTIRYMSIYAQQGFSQSRRDDMHGVVNMFVHFIRGKLPWMGINAVNEAERMKKVREKKEKLLAGSQCPFIQMIRKLRFRERPDYTGLYDFIAKAQELPGVMKDAHRIQWRENCDASDVDDDVLKDVHRIKRLASGDSCPVAPDHMLSLVETRHPHLSKLLCGKM